MHADEPGVLRLWQTAPEAQVSKWLGHAWIRGALLIFVLTFSAAISIVLLRQHQVDEQRNALRFTVGVLARHADQLVDGIRQSGHNVAEQLARASSQSMPVENRGIAVGEILRSAMRDKPFIGKLIVADSSGATISEATRADGNTVEVFSSQFGPRDWVIRGFLDLDHFYSAANSSTAHQVRLIDQQRRVLGPVAPVSGNVLTTSAQMQTQPWTIALSSPQHFAFAGWSQESMGSAIAILLLDGAIILLVILGSRHFANTRQATAAANRLARIDPLTELPNRLNFHEELKLALGRAQRLNETIAIIAIDLDGFKSVNDRFGHSCGDELLQVAAMRMRRRLRDGDLLARVGGDEFAIIQSRVLSPEMTARLAGHIADAFADPFVLASGDVRLSASLGAALALQDGSDIAELLGKADLALFESKRERLGRLVFYAPRMSQAAARSAELRAALADAVANEQFDILYQPVLSLEENEIISCEALLRWDHPRLGPVAPQEFIPILERTGGISTVGQFVLQRACERAVTWPGDMRVAVNLSPIQISSPGFSKLVEDILEETGLAPERLELEITESVSLETHDGVVATLHEIRGLGVKIALDDFGTGYASMSYLTQFPFDRIKIDRSFVEALGSKAGNVICRTTIEMARRLGMGTTAEGVESEEQLMMLRRKGCSEVQGYFVSPPLPSHALDAFLRSFERKGGGALFSDALTAAVPVK